MQLVEPDLVGTTIGGVQNRYVGFVRESEVFKELELEILRQVRNLC